MVLEIPQGKKKLKRLLKAWKCTWRYVKWKEYMIFEWRGCFSSKMMNCFLMGESPKCYYPSPIVYKAVKKYFPEHLVPMVTEIFHRMTSYCFYRGYANLYKMMIFDDLEWKGEVYCKSNFAEKNFLYTLMEIHLTGKHGESDYYGDPVFCDAIQGMVGIDLEYTRDILKIVRENWETYFDKIVFPLISSIHGEETWERAFGKKREITYESVLARLSDLNDLNPDAVKFIVEDALYYVNMSDSHCYSPFWLFGSEHYAELLEKIWTLKMNIPEYCK